MAQSGLKPDGLFTWAGTLVLAAGAVTRFNGSRRRSRVDSNAMDIDHLIRELVALHRQMLLLLTANQSDDEAQPFAVFYCASTVRTLLYELDHELIGLPEPEKLVRHITLLDQLRKDWESNLEASVHAGIFDAWFVEHSLSTVLHLSRLGKPTP
jgi:hypothetical protein